MGSITWRLTSWKELPRQRKSGRHRAGELPAAALSSHNRASAGVRLPGRGIALV